MNPVVTLAVLQRLCCINVFQQTELAAAGRAGFLLYGSRTVPESLVTADVLAVKLLLKSS